MRQSRCLERGIIRCLRSPRGWGRFVPRARIRVNASMCTGGQCAPWEPQTPNLFLQGWQAWNTSIVDLRFTSGPFRRAVESFYFYACFLQAVVR